MNTELTAPLQSIFDDSERTPAGRSFYAGDDLMMREAARTLAPQPGYYVVDIHGTADRAKVGPHWLDADSLASLIRAAPEWEGQDIFLMCCDTGRRKDGFAQQLSDALRVEVSAPDKLAWSDFEPGGGAQPYSSDGCLDASGMPRPVKPPTGTFVTFVPADRDQGSAGGGRDAGIDGGEQVAGAVESGTGSDGTRLAHARLGMLHRPAAGKAMTPTAIGTSRTVGAGPDRRGTRLDRGGDQVRGE